MKNINLQPLLAAEAEKSVESPEAKPKLKHHVKMERKEADPAYCGSRKQWKKLKVETLCHWYRDQKLTCRKIGKRLGISAGAVQSKLAELHITTRNPAERAALLCEDLTGHEFGDLIVLGPAPKKKSHDRCLWWKTCCKICNAVTIKRGSTLRLHLAKTCGNHVWKGCGDLSGTYWSSLRHGAKTRGIPFEIAIDFGWSLFLNQNKRCALSGELLTMAKSLSLQTTTCSRTQTASLDRKDPAKGYTAENVQWIHKDLNSLKLDLTQEKFLNWIKKIYEFKIRHNKVV